MKVEIELNDFVVEEIVAKDLRARLELGALTEEMYEHFERVLTWYEPADFED